jgi:hypothetical protein
LVCAPKVQHQWTGSRVNESRHQALQGGEGQRERRYEVFEEQAVRHGFKKKAKAIMIFHLFYYLFFCSFAHLFHAEAERGVAHAHLTQKTKRQTKNDSTMSTLTNKSPSSSFIRSTE